MSSWRTASSQQQSGIKARNDIRRFSEWPVSLPVDEWELWVIDPASVLMKRVSHEIDAPRDLFRVRPAEQIVLPRWNVVACGFAARIIAAMLYEAANHVQHPTDSPQPSDMPFYIIHEWSGGLSRADLLEMIADRETSIDAVMWYDVGGEDTLQYLALLKGARDRSRPGCPLLVFRPLPSVERYARELDEVEHGRLLAGAFGVFNELLEAIGSKTDSDPYGYLQRLPQR